ncbi:MAG: asparagine synthetase B, partial [Saprospiraceae bacterium]
MAQSHRGPDGQGIWLGPGIALGHRRLSIIDLSHLGDQPMHDVSNRYTLVYNGEIYNYRELKALLPQYPFRSDSDSELVLAAYIRWGAECLLKFRGMFAFAIWDSIDKSLFLARDPFGVKPLYYSHIGNTIVFASEVRAMLASGIISHRLNAESIQDYLIDQAVYAPFSMLEDVCQISAGSYLKYSKGKVEGANYLPELSTIYKGGSKDHESDLLPLLQQSIARRMVSDVPVGAFLSGG